MDRFTRTRIPARYSRYGHNTLDLQYNNNTCSRKRTLFPSTVLAAVITVTAKYLSFVGGQGWPAMPLEAERASIVGRAVIYTWKQQQLDYIFF